MSTLLILVIVAALIFDFTNGWNDAANSIATVVSTRVLTPLLAVLFAASLNFAGALVSTRVAKMIGQGLLDPKQVNACPELVLAAMLAAAGWVIVCTFKGLPISGSHSLIGGLVGAGMATLGGGSLRWGGLTWTLAGMVISPVLGMIGGFLGLVAVYWIARRMTPRLVRRVFSVLQLFSSGFVSFTHGTNDAQKTMGVITLALFASGRIPSLDVPLWVMLLSGGVIALGTASGGWKVIQTVGMKLADIRPIEGFAAETACGGVLAGAAALGIPVSTTHTVTGAILGVGTAQHARSVKWGLGFKIMSAWVLTLPACALLGAALSPLFRMILSH